MALQLGDTAPDFEAQTTEGPIKFHDWIGDSWAVLFSHPKDFTPICTTELGYMASIKPEFDRRGVKVIGLSVDSLDRHSDWSNDIEETQGHAPNYPIISDDDFNVSKLYGMLPEDTSGDSAPRTPADNQTVRNVFVIGPDKKVKLILVYPMTTGRNFDEVLRVIDSLQLTAKHRVATPAQWQPGERRGDRRFGLERRGEGSLRRMGRAEALHQDRAAAAVSRFLQIQLAARGVVGACVGGHSSACSLWASRQRRSRRAADRPGRPTERCRRPSGLGSRSRSPWAARPYRRSRRAPTR